MASGHHNYRRGWCSHRYTALSLPFLSEIFSSSHLFDPQCKKHRKKSKRPRGSTLMSFSCDPRWCLSPAMSISGAGNTFKLVQKRGDGTDEASRGWGDGMGWLLTDEQFWKLFIYKFWEGAILELHHQLNSANVFFDYKVQILKRRDFFGIWYSPRIFWSNEKVNGMIWIISQKNFFFSFFLSWWYQFIKWS